MQYWLLIKNSLQIIAFDILLWSLQLNWENMTINYFNPFNSVSWLYMYSQNILVVWKLLAGLSGFCSVSVGMCFMCLCSVKYIWPKICLCFFPMWLCCKIMWMELKIIYLSSNLFMNIYTISWVFWMRL